MKTFNFNSTREAYAATQTRDDIETGDALVILSERVVGLADTWPIAVTVDCGELHKFADGPISLDDFDFDFDDLKAVEQVARNAGFELDRAEAKPAAVFNECSERTLTYLCSDAEAQAFVDATRCPEMGLHLCIEDGHVRIKCWSTTDASESMRAGARADRYLEIARCNLVDGYPPKVKRVYIFKTFDGDVDGGFRFATVYFNKGRGGWIFNCSLPNRGPSRKAWPTWSAALPRWIKKESGLHFSLVTEA